MLLNRFPDFQLGNLTNLRVKQKCFWASQYFATCILPIFTCPTLFIFVPLELCNLKSSLHSLDTGGPLAIPGQLWSTPCPSQQRCTSGASPASVVTPRQQYQQIRLRTADWHRQRLTNRIQSDCKVVPFKLTRLSMTFYDFLPVMCINSPVPSLSPAQARRSRTVCQCYGKDLPAVSCVHCVHLFQFSEFPDCLDSMHVHLCVAICCNMLEYVAFSCVFPFQHSLPVQKKQTRPASKTLFRFSHSFPWAPARPRPGPARRLVQVATTSGIGPWGAMPCKVKHFSRILKLSKFLKHKHIKVLKRHKTSQRESNIASICSTSGFSHFSHLWSSLATFPPSQQPGQSCQPQQSYLWQNWRHLW